MISTDGSGIHGYTYALPFSRTKPDRSVSSCVTNPRPPLSMAWKTKSSNRGIAQLTPALIPLLGLVWRGDTGSFIHEGRGEGRAHTHRHSQVLTRPSEAFGDGLSSATSCLCIPSRDGWEDKSRKRGMRNSHLRPHVSARFCDGAERAGKGGASDFARATHRGRRPYGGPRVEDVWGVPVRRRRSCEGLESGCSVLGSMRKHQGRYLEFLHVIG